MATYQLRPVIWTNINGAGAWCTIDVVDVNQWEPGFVNAFTWYLAAEMAQALTGSAAAEQSMQAMGRDAALMAMQAEGNEETTVASWNAEWVDARDEGPWGGGGYGFGF